LNKGDFTKTTLSIVWLLFTLPAVETYNLSSELPMKIYQLHYPASRTSFSGTITSLQKNSSCIGTEKSYLCKVLHFNRQNVMLIAPNDWATAYGRYWKYPTGH